jgi:hypothetical protein
MRQGTLFKSVHFEFILGVVARPGRQLGKAESLQFTTNRGLVHRDPEFLEDPVDQILAPPPNDTVDSRDRTTLYNLGQGLALIIIQLGPIVRSLAVEEPGKRVFMKRTTQSRTICKVTPPIRVAYVREPPS